jgi:hypothetical protein
MLEVDGLDVEVSGLAVATIPLFIKDKFGDEGFEKWLSKLEPEIQQIYKSVISVNKWFDIKQVFIEPTKILCDMFYEGDFKAAWEFGRFSADYGLKGVLKVFVKLASVNYFINRASVVIPNYYTPMTMDVITNEKGHAILQIPHFPGLHKIVELRIAGWMERALEITGNTKELDVKITKSLTEGDDYTEFEVKWS